MAETESDRAKDIYYASSQMLNDNEMLVTLQHNGNNTGSSEGKNISMMDKEDNQENGATDAENTFETECERHTCGDETETAVPHNITTDSSLKIFTVLSSDMVEASDHSETLDNLFSDVSENDNGVKTLTILNPVQPHNSDNLELISISESVDFSDSINEQSDDNFIIEEVGQSGQNSGGTDFNTENASTAKQPKGSPSQQSTCLINRTKPKPSRRVKRKNIKSKPVRKNSKSISIDLEKLTVPLNEKLKRNTVVQTYTHKKKNKDDKPKFNPGQKLYQKIPLPSEEEEEVFKVPEQIPVYEFYDEEEERRKAEKAKKDKELQALKERTCGFCKEEFSDPMDVLRHKREFHKAPKVLVSRKELEPYLNLENRTHCPLCYKEVCPLGYKSIYIKHLMVHCQDPNFTCRVCGIKFKRKDHLQSHEKRHIVNTENVE